MTTLFDTILEERQLQAVFQPIVATNDLRILGYEGLIRGPAGSALESPAMLFRHARNLGRQRELERECLRTIWRRFAQLELPGKLFANVSASMLLWPAPQGRMLGDYLLGLDVDPARLVIEITEEQAVQDYVQMRQVTTRLMAQGFRLAIDDLGAGFSSLRLWLELQPAFVKLDNAFVRGIENDKVRRAILCAVQHVARAAGSQVIAEGVECAEELAALRDIGIAFSQGYHIARPSSTPPRTLAALAEA